MGIQEAYAELVEGIYYLRQPLRPGLLAPSYDSVETFASGDKLAARYVITGARSDGARFSVHGISMNEWTPEGFTCGWSLNDYRDLKVLTSAAPAVEVVDRWGSDAVRGAPGSHLATYLALIDAIYKQRDVSKIARFVDERYLSIDPFIDRAVGRAGVAEFHSRVLAEFSDVDYRVVDAVEQDDRLAVRYVARGTRHDGSTSTVLGLSINHFESNKLRRGWVMNHYAGVDARIASRTQSTS